MNKNRSQNILLAEIMVAVLFFALCSTVILELFVAAKEYSGRSERESEALLIAQDLAEQLYASDDTRSMLFGQGFTQTEDEWICEREGYSLTVAAEEEIAAAGFMRKAQISIRQDGDLLAEIPMVRYVPGGVSE